MSNISNIEPCPYCGFKYPVAKVEDQEVIYYRKVSFAYVYCSECHARGRLYHDIEVYSGIVEAAIMAWNLVAIVFKKE